MTTAAGCHRLTNARHAPAELTGRGLRLAVRTLKATRLAPHAPVVGNSGDDRLAARAEGLPARCAPYGYNEGEDPRGLPCDGLIESLAELPSLLRAPPARGAAGSV